MSEQKKFEVQHVRKVTFITVATMLVSYVGSVLTFDDSSTSILVNALVGICALVWQAWNIRPAAIAKAVVERELKAIIKLGGDQR